MPDQKELISQTQIQAPNHQKSNTDELSPIPDKIYFSIGEVSELCNLKPHVLRYWEQEFSLLNPSKRRGNRRYYQRKDVLLVRQIKNLLYDKGYTIEGARAQLSGDNTSELRKMQHSHVKLQLAIA